jgi:hypothetical protein
MVLHGCALSYQLRPLSDYLAVNLRISDVSICFIFLYFLFGSLESPLFMSFKSRAKSRGYWSSLAEPIENLQSPLRFCAAQGGFSFLL